MQSMVQELEKAQVTELTVRMDCFGCVQKIKRAMNFLDGVDAVYVDVVEQKLTVVGNVEPDKIVRALKRTRRIGTICSHAQANEPSSSEPPAAEQAENSTPSASETPETAALEVKEAFPGEPKQEEEIYMVHYYPHRNVAHNNKSNMFYPSITEYPCICSSPSLTEAYEYCNESRMTSIFSDENPNACRIV